MDYKKTLNLPQTAFPMQARLTEMEPKIRARWEKERMYEKIQKARKGAPKYILHDGPPYANGDVHIGTGQNKVLKDIVVRYQTMRGRDAPFIPGWDCHGLPIEAKVMEQQKANKEQKTADKSAIRKLCHEFAMKYVDIQRRQFQSLGVLGAWEAPYLTLDPEYELSVIELFEELWKREHVTKRRKPIHWCMNCRTALAEAELEYKTLPSPSIYVKFPLVENPRYSLLIWTTTPWTLPANVAVAISSHHRYESVQFAKLGTEILIVGEAALPRLVELFGSYQLASEPFKGNLSYRHPLFDKECPVVDAPYVRMEDGTGLVHTAPGHGEEDYQTGLQYHLPVVSPVDEAGVFTSEAPEFVRGKNVFEANALICDELKRRGLLVHQEEITHEYPCCWRCKNPVIFRATEQWFIKVDEKDGRKRALEAVRQTKWVPKWGEVRIASMLEQRPDWCISRQRSWGVPIPAFYCAKCGEVLLSAQTFAAVKTLFREKGGANAWFTTEARAILPLGTKCAKCGGAEFRKEQDIFDVWFESAASHRAVCMKHPELRDHFPPELYLEGTDQHRGWFQVSLLASILSQDKAPFQTVVTHGFLVDARTGDKLSKSGFLIPVDEVVTKLGADLLRLWIASIDFTDDLPISWDILKERAEPYKKIRNTFRFLLGNVYDFDAEKDGVPAEKMLELDRWALLRLHQVVDEVTQHFDEFEFFKAYHKLYNFCVVDLSALYFAMIKDRLYCSGAKSVERRSAQTVLHEILLALTKMYAPILCHTAEEIWGYIPGKKEAESVCLAKWAHNGKTAEEASFTVRWGNLLAVRDEVNKELEKLRAQKVIGSSLEARVALLTTNADYKHALESYKHGLEELFIVSEVTLADELSATMTESAEVKGLFLHVEQCPYPKCERCWNLKKSVGEDKEHPTLCARCVAVVKNFAR